MWYPEGGQLILLSIFFVCVTRVCSEDSEVAISLDEQPDHNDVCGRVYDISNGNKSVVSANGRVHGGACGVTFRAINTDEYVCDKICVTLKSKTLDTCQVKVKFTGIVFSGLESDRVKEYDCRNSFDGPWCPKADLLQVYVLESGQYTLEWTDRKLYSLHVDISPSCQKLKTDPVAATEQKISKRYNEETSHQKYKNKLEGIVVGVCLCLIFLVAMGVMCCYYKAKREAENPPDQRNRGTVPIISTIKSKIFGNKQNRSMSSEPVQSEETYEPIIDESFRSIGKKDSISGSAQKERSDIVVEEKDREISHSAATLVLEQETTLLAEQKV